MINIRHKFLAATLLLALGATQVASAVVVSDSLGNTAPGFNDGDIPDIFQLGAAQGGQLPPFDTSYGTDIALAGGTGTNFSKDWTHNYGAIAGSIISASITIGIVDHDSSAAGSQLESFSVGGFDYTSDLGTLFETAGHGEEAEYNVYTVSLGGAALFTSLANGSALISLALDGPGQVVGLFGGDRDDRNEWRQPHFFNADHRIPGFHHTTGADPGGRAAVPFGDCADGVIPS